jgi:hypothetical protein
MQANFDSFPNLILENDAVFTTSNMVLMWYDGVYLLIRLICGSFL